MFHKKTENVEKWVKMGMIIGMTYFRKTDYSWDEYVDVVDMQHARVKQKLNKLLTSKCQFNAILLYFNFSGRKKQTRRQIIANATVARFSRNYSLFNFMEQYT
jgi:hypothetical protein